MSISQAPQNGFKVIIDDSRYKGQNGKMERIHKQTKQVKIEGVETSIELNEALMTVLTDTKSLVSRCSASQLQKRLGHSSVETLRALLL